MIVEFLFTETLRNNRDSKSPVLSHFLALMQQQGSPRARGQMIPYSEEASVAAPPPQNAASTSLALLHQYWKVGEDWALISYSFKRQTSISQFWSCHFQTGICLRYTFILFCLDALCSVCLIGYPGWTAFQLGPFGIWVVIKDWAHHKMTVRLSQSREFTFILEAANF